MKLEEVSKDIFHVNFPVREELAMTFLRFQEHYESPEFRRKIFTLDEFKKWYIENSPKGKETGEFTYYSDWSGFNIPSEILKPFYEGKFNPLSEREQTFLDLFRAKEHPFYVIGTYGGSNSGTLKHEIAHGLFYTNPKYKEEVLKVLEKISREKRVEINRYLSEGGGYHQEVWDDETHAFILIGSSSKSFERSVDITTLLEIKGELDLIFEKHFSGFN